MVLKVGDVVKLFHKNIHISARAKHFRQLQPSDFVLVRIKAIDVRGEGRQKGQHATVTYPATLEQGQAIVWEGITKPKNLVLHEAAEAVAAAPGVLEQPAAAVADQIEQLVSDGDDDMMLAPENDEAAPQGLREGWRWGPCSIDGRTGERAYDSDPCYLFDDSMDVESPFDHFKHFFIGRTRKDTNSKPLPMWRRQFSCDWNCAAAKRISFLSKKSSSLPPSRAKLPKSFACASRGSILVAP